MSVRLVHYSDIENACDDPVRMGQLAGTIQSIHGEDTVVAGTGDNTAPGVLAHYCEGRQALPFFRAVSTDVETVGNHDFDFGTAPILDVISESPQEWIVANVTDGDSESGCSPGIAELDGTTVLHRDGQLVGFVGVIDPATPRIAPTGASELTVTSPVESVRTALSELSQTVDQFVVLAHLRSDFETAVAAVDGVDVVLGGHVHRERHEIVDGTLVVRPGANGQVVWEVELFDGNRPPMATRHSTAEGPIDESMADTTREQLADVDLLETVATVDDPIYRDIDRRTRGESRVGNLVADAYRWAADADVAFVHNGGLREGRPLSGEVTAGEMASVNPFRGKVEALHVSGDQLRTLLDAAFRPHRDDGRLWHGDISGMTVEYDTEAGRLVSVAVNDQPIEAGREYRIATSSYVVYSDDWPIPRETTVDSFGPPFKTVADYARQEGLTVQVDGRLREC
ncbi:2', 3'-cyclic nucleotide 2'-phosphodiesterase [Haloarcula rubripromontorii]|uniref:2', 3'-cyclic nucleotide 2'-phosphodiesterase n=1 Tax=Haloarcula rubripromontorii TaxID=1705562 RepID=A0A0N0BPL8_9EURY|nr:bifunctional metallophosphatase/5'-nucleotidase [Haloarcula rubripromontorii]KOX94124.1 2', 3'-cyclic nucleotide 2'-phosphodiesterase [Haloarcula rubripromontorii]